MAERDPAVDGFLFGRDALPEPLSDVLDTHPDLLRDEVAEALQRAASLDEREKIHYPDIIEFIPPLSNGSRILAIDYRTIPGNTSKVVPIDHEFRRAEERGEINLQITPTLIVHSSGNASIWATKIARQKGYNVEVVIPDNASTPRLNALCALGANLHLVRGELGVQGLIDRAHNLEAVMVGAKFLDQTHSDDNYNAFIPHGKRAARKLLLLGIRPTHLVVGAGTGGTFTGLSMGVSELIPGCERVAVELKEKPFLAQQYGDACLALDVDAFIAGETGDDKFWVETYQGAGQVPGLAANVGGINLMKLFQEGQGAKVVTLSNESALRSSRLLGRRFSQYVGPSTGATFAAAYALASTNPGAVILMPVSDQGSQYDGELWHKKKRTIEESNMRPGFVGSTIIVRDRVHQDESTRHLGVREMGGPLGTAAILYFMENVARDLERAAGLIDDTNDSVGIGFDNRMQHKTYTPVGSELIAQAKLISLVRKGDKWFITTEVSLHALDKDGQEIEVCNPMVLKRCILPIAKFREGALERFLESKL